MSSHAIKSSYGSGQSDRQCNAHTPDDMEPIEKACGTGKGRGTTQKAGGNQTNTNKTAPPAKQQDAQKEDEGEGLLSPTLWTCGVCRLQMSISSRTEHLARGHMPKDEKQTRKSKKGGQKSAELSDPNTQMWHCELCDEELSISLAAAHTAGRKHSLKLNQRGRNRYTPASGEVIEHRAVYKPQEGEEALAAESLAVQAYDDDEEEEESAVYRPDRRGERGHGDSVPDGETSGGRKLQESAGFGLEEKEKDEDWESGDGTSCPPPAHKAQHSRLNRPTKPKAAPRPAAAQYPVQTPVGFWHPGPPPGTEYMYPEQTPAGTQYQTQPPPGLQHPGQTPPGTHFEGQPLAALQYLLQSPAGIQCLIQQLAAMQRQMQLQAGSLYQWQPPLGMRYPMQAPMDVQYPLQPPAGTQYPGQHPPPPPPPQPPSQPSDASTAGDQVQEPASPRTAAVHIQVPTFYCDLCDTEYPTSEQNEHPEETLECIICEDVYHANQYAAHLASRDHKESAKAQAYAVTAAVSRVEPPAPSSPPAPPSPSPSPPPAAPKPPDFHCQICDRTMGEDSRQSHLAGSKHRVKLQELAVEEGRLRWGSRRRGLDSALPAMPENLSVHSWESHVAGSEREENVEAEAVVAAPQNASGAWVVVESSGRQNSSSAPRRWSQNTGPRYPVGGAAGSPHVMQYYLAKFHCKPCGITMHINNKETHLSGAKHSEAVTGNRPEEAPASQGSGAGSSGGGGSGPSAPLVAAADPPQPMQYAFDSFHCKPCGITMHNNNKETHLGGVKHREALTGNRPEGAPASLNSGAGSSSSGTPVVISPPSQYYHCTVCNLNMPVLEYQHHKYGKTHRYNELTDT